MTETLPDRQNKHKITYSFSYSTPSGASGQYEAVKLLSDGDSIRRAAVEVISEVKRTTPDLITSEPLEDTPISIYIANDKIKNYVDEWNTTSQFGLNYALGQDGSLMILNGYTPLHHDWTAKEINELVDEAYVPGDPNHLILGVPLGLGAGGQDIVLWAGFLSDVLSLSGVGFKAMRFLWEHFRLREVRRTAKKWTTKGILYPEQLREFIDTKSGWRIEEIRRRLRVNEEFAYKLLEALGLEPVGNEWRLTHFKKSISKRKSWVRNEKKYQQIREKMTNET